MNSNKKFKPSVRESDIAWMRKTISLLNDGGTWGIPRNRSVWKFYKSEKRAELISGDPEDVTNLITKTILKEHLNWEVKTNDH